MDEIRSQDVAAKGTDVPLRVSSFLIVQHARLGRRLRGAEHLPTRMSAGTDTRDITNSMDRRCRPQILPRRVCQSATGGRDCRVDELSSARGYAVAMSDSVDAGCEVEIAGNDYGARGSEPNYWGKSSRRSPGHADQRPWCRPAIRGSLAESPPTVCGGDRTDTVWLKVRIVLRNWVLERKRLFPATGDCTTYSFNAAAAVDECDIGPGVSGASLLGVTFSARPMRALPDASLP